MAIDFKKLRKNISKIVASSKSIKIATGRYRSLKKQSISSSSPSVNRLRKFLFEDKFQSDEEKIATLLENLKKSCQEFKKGLKGRDKDEFEELYRIICDLRSKSEPITYEQALDLLHKFNVIVEVHNTRQKSQDIIISSKKFKTFQSFGITVFALSLAFTILTSRNNNKKEGDENPLRIIYTTDDTNHNKLIVVDDDDYKKLKPNHSIEGLEFSIEENNGDSIENSSSLQILDIKPVTVDNNLKSNNTSELLNDSRTIS